MFPWTWTEQLASEHRGDLLAAARRDHPHRHTWKLRAQEWGVLRRMVGLRRAGTVGVSSPVTTICAAG